MWLSPELYHQLQRHQLEVLVKIFAQLLPLQILQQPVLPSNGMPPLPEELPWQPARLWLMPHLISRVKQLEDVNRPIDWQLQPQWPQLLRLQQEAQVKTFVSQELYLIFQRLDLLFNGTLLHQEALHCLLDLA